MGYTKNRVLQILTLFLGLLGQGVRCEYGDLAGDWLVDYGQQELKLLEGESQQVELHIYNVIPKDPSLDYYFEVYSRDDQRALSLVTIPKEDFDLLGSWRGLIDVTVWRR